MRTRGVTLMELLVVLSLVALLVCVSIPTLLCESAAVVRRHCVQELSQVLRYARLQAYVHQHALSIQAVSDNNWADGVRLLSGDTVLHEWSWHHPGLQLTWHGFRSNQQLIIDYDLAQFAMNGYFSIELRGESLPRITVTRFGQVN